MPNQHLFAVQWRPQVSNLIFLEVHEFQLCPPLFRRAMDGWMDGWMDARMDGQISNCPHLHQAYLKEIGVYSSFWLTQYYIILILIPVPSLTFHYPRQDTRSRSVSSPHDRSPAQDVASAPYPCIPCSGLTAVRSSAVVIICCSGISQGCDDDHPSW